MKPFFALILLINVAFSFELPDINIPSQIKNIGKKTPIDIELYIKNPSTICSLRVENISNPYNQNIKTKLPTIFLKPGSYFRKNITYILKGKYEFEYKWFKNNRFIDSGAEVVHIFAYHDTSLSLHKRVDITFEDKIPSECK